MTNRMPRVLDFFKTKYKKKQTKDTMDFGLRSIIQYTNLQSIQSH